MSEKVHSSTVVGRFAPSPTGPLHFGSLVAAVGSFCLARQAGGVWRVRIEDLDTPRIVPGAGDDILRTLEALSLHWDGEVVFQSLRTESYEMALEILRDKSLIFPCGCSRREIFASAPHSGEEGPVYPGTCRHGLSPGRRPRSLRIQVPAEMVQFFDGVFGNIAECLDSTVGDFVLRRADGLFAYQLAVVVDDAEAGVNQVVRGADLLSSTARQIFLNACLGNPIPRYIHLPLALDERGEKVSKRHGTFSSRFLEDKGLLLWRVLQFLGQSPPLELKSCAPGEILLWGITHFTTDRVPRDSRVMADAYELPESGERKRHG